MLWVLQLRILRVLLQILVWFDQGLGIILASPFYIIFGHPRPNADETISSVVGRYAMNGYRWALICEWIIDRIFYVFEGFELGHCRKRIEYEDIDWENLPL